jgi:hypothetical protein
MLKLSGSARAAMPGIGIDIFSHGGAAAAAG